MPRKQFAICFADDPEGAAMVKAVCDANAAADAKKKATAINAALENIEALLNKVYATQKRIMDVVDNIMKL